MFSKIIATLLSINKIMNHMQTPLDFMSILKVVCLKCWTNIRARVNKPILHTGSFCNNTFWIKIGSA